MKNFIITLFFFCSSAFGAVFNETACPTNDIDTCLVSVNAVDIDGEFYDLHFEYGTFSDVYADGFTDLPWFGNEALSRNIARELWAWTYRQRKEGFIGRMIDPATSSVGFAALPSRFDEMSGSLGVVQDVVLVHQSNAAGGPNGVSDHIPASLNILYTVPVRTVPEIDANSVSLAFGLILGLLVLFRERLLGR